MLAKQVLDKEIEPLDVDDRISVAIERMKDLNVGTLPVVDGSTRKLIGQVSLEGLERSSTSFSISEIELENAIKVYVNQHIFEAVRLMLQHEIRILAVVEKDWIWKGTICKPKVLESITSMLNIAELGSVITIRVLRRDYTLSEIVQIIETEGAKILGITVEIAEENQKTFEVSVKLNLQDVSRVSAALSRYGYNIYTGPGYEHYNMDIETRADELIKYLDM